MELASVVNRDATNVRKTRMRAFAESEVQRDINDAKNDGREATAIKVPTNIDVQMLQKYIEDFGYEVVDAGKADRNLRISWQNPKK